MVVTAVIGGTALVGAGASVISGNKAANATTQAAEQSAGVQKYIYDTTRQDYAPYRDVGTSALNKLAGLYGVKQTAPAPTANLSDFYSGGVGRAYGYEPGTSYTIPGIGTFNIPTAANNNTPAPANDQPYGGFETSPGYQFRVDEARKAIEHSASAAGKLRSGATMDAIQRRVQGVASDEYENYTNHLAALAGVGQTASNTVAQAGANYASGASQAYQAAGAGRASAYTNTGNAINSGVGGVAQAYLYSRGYGGGIGGAVSGGFNG